MAGQPIIDATAADPVPLALLPAHDALRFPVATARTLDLADSTNVAEARYDTQSGTLWVTFTSGGQYRYLDVETDIIAQWESADSAGEFFAQNIKSEYDSDRVG